jgi:putative membrane protein
MHFAGGGLFPLGQKLYTWVLIPIVGEPYNILAYDQVVHGVGFFVATIFIWQVMQYYIRVKKKGFALGLTVIMAGVGLGAVNEIVEFIATVIVPDNGVGGYVNTSLDLIFNCIGATAGWIYIKKK